MGSGRLDRTSGRSLFGSDAAGYHSGRIGYPDGLFEHVFDRVADDPRILEIGAGTGLATQELLKRARHLSAVEPDPALCDFLAQRFPDDGRLAIINAPFLAADLPSDYDLVAAAASFHWLEPEPALARIRKVLRPGGVCALWWNTYRVCGIGDAFADATSALLNDVDLPPSEGRLRHYSLDVEHHVSSLRNAGFGVIRHDLFRRERHLSAAQMRALYASYSFVRALPACRRSHLLDSISDLVDNEFGGMAPNVILSAIYSAVSPP